jgi:hypothetical protein
LFGISSLTVTPQGEIFALGGIEDSDRAEIVRIDRSTGAMDVLSRPESYEWNTSRPTIGVGPSFGRFPLRIRATPEGDLIVLSDESGSGPYLGERISIVDHLTGDRRLIQTSSEPEYPYYFGQSEPVGAGPYFRYPKGLAVSNDGRIVVAGLLVTEPVSVLMEIDPSTGSATGIYDYSTADRIQPGELAIADDGSIIAAGLGLMAFEPDGSSFRVLSYSSIGSGANIHSITAIAIVPQNLAVPEPCSLVLAVIATIGLGVFGMSRGLRSRD